MENTKKKQKIQRAFLEVMETCQKNTKCIFQNLMINVRVCVLKRGISRTSLITSNSINQWILPYFQTNPCTEVVILLRIPNVQSKHIEAI